MEGEELDEILPLEPNKYRVQESIDKKNYEDFEAALAVKQREQEKKKEEKRAIKEQQRREKKAKRDEKEKKKAKRAKRAENVWSEKLAPPATTTKVTPIVATLEPADDGHVAMFPEAPAVLERDEWMLRPLPRTNHKREEEERQRKEEEERKEEEKKRREQRDKEEAEKNKVIRTQDYLVGDGGASWRSKAKLRAVEQGMDPADTAVLTNTNKGGNWRDRRSDWRRDRNSDAGDNKRGDWRRDRGGDDRGGYRGDREGDRDGDKSWRVREDRDSDRRDRGERDRERDRDRDAEWDREIGRRDKERDSSRGWRKHDRDRRDEGQRDRDNRDDRRRTEDKRRDEDNRDNRDDRRRDEDRREVETVVQPAAKRSNLDPNEIAALALKARLMGDTEGFQKLQEQLVEAKANERNEEEGGKQKTVLHELDASARSRQFYDDTKRPAGRRPEKKTLQSHEDKERLRYYKDDDNVDLNTLMRREKHGVDNYNKNYTENITGNKHYKLEGKEPDFDDEYVNVDIYESKEKKMNKDKLQQRHKQTATRELHKREKEESSCFHCFENKKIPSHQLISLGDYTYLMLPSAPLCPGHCLIAPIEHSTKGLPALETNQWNEVEKFMKGITKMNYKMGGCGTIFMETNINMKKGRHTVLECFRVEADACATARGYFKKALEDEGSEWAQHRKVLYTDGARGVRSFPQNFAYFYVQFGMTQGLAHLIENENKFPPNFGHEILAAVMGLDREFIGKNKRLTVEQGTEMAKEFLKAWLPFDWTTELDGGEL